jgi:predicted nucleotidyltransferase
MVAAVPTRRLDPSTEALLERCRSLLAGHYGRRFAGLLLYGSVARGQAGEGSDLDLLVLLRGDLDYFRELRILVDLLEPVQLDSPWLISARPAPVEEFEAGTRALYRSALAEGLRF